MFKKVWKKEGGAGGREKTFPQKVFPSPRQIMSFLISILSGLGIGGGGLLVIWLALSGGVGQLEAQGINLVYFLFSSGAAMLVHLTKRKLKLRLIIFLAVFGTIGAVAGSFLARATDPTIIKHCFGWLLLVSGILAICQK